MSGSGLRGTGNNSREPVPCRHEWCQIGQCQTGWCQHGWCEPVRCEPDRCRPDPFHPIPRRHAMCHRSGHDPLDEPVQVVASPAGTWIWGGQPRQPGAPCHSVDLWRELPHQNATRASPVPGASTPPTRCHGHNPRHAGGVAPAGKTAAHRVRVDIDVRLHPEAPRFHLQDLIPAMSKGHLRPAIHLRKRAPSRSRSDNSANVRLHSASRSISESAGRAGMFSSR